MPNGRLHILPRPEFTREYYEKLIFREVLIAMAGVPEAMSAHHADREKVRRWGLLEFPDFQLSPAQIDDAVTAATALRKTRVP